MKVTLDEVAMLPSGDHTLAVDANATRMADHLTGHVLGRVAGAARRCRPIEHRFPADRPFCDVIWPLVGSY